MNVYIENLQFKCCISIKLAGGHPNTLFSGVKIGAVSGSCVELFPIIGSYAVEVIHSAANYDDGLKFAKDLEDAIVKHYSERDSILAQILPQPIYEEIMEH